MTQPPEKIYLQWIGTEYKWTNYEEGDVTWCEHRINDDDIVYIRSDKTKLRGPDYRWLRLYKEETK